MKLEKNRSRRNMRCGRSWAMARCHVTTMGWKQDPPNSHRAIELAVRRQLEHRQASRGDHEPHPLGQAQRARPLLVPARRHGALADAAGQPDRRVAAPSLASGYGIELIALWRYALPLKHCGRDSMATPELIESWARTEALLREARAALPAELATDFASDLEQFNEFLEHNELGLAFDCLHGIIEESNCASSSLIRPLLMAAENMGRGKLQQALSRKLASLGT